MVEPSLYAGAAMRRLRRRENLTQAVMAQRLSISPSYLNLIERNQRPVTARVIVQLADQFAFDPRNLRESEAIGGVDGLARRLADERFTDLGIDREECNEFLAAAPQAAAAFARLYDQGGGANLRGARAEAEVRREIERWQNHYADLDAVAEELADNLRLNRADIGAALTDHLRDRHALALRFVPQTILLEGTRRLDLHARQVQLSEMLTPAARNLALAMHIAELEQGEAIANLLGSAKFDHPAARDIYEAHLKSYFAHALLMPYSRFLRACENSSYDPLVLARRFGANITHVARRFTTLQRVGQRGLPFFMGLFDRAGQLGERLLGASGASLLDRTPVCPRWNAFAARAENWSTQALLLEDSALGPAHWVTASRIAPPNTDETERAILVIGLEARFAQGFTLAAGLAAKPEDAMPVGPGCARCMRPECPARTLSGPAQAPGA